MGQLAVLLILVAFVATLFGFFPIFNPFMDWLHRIIYGTGLAHPKGTAQEHINDWLGFLPPNDFFRAIFVAAILVLGLVINVVTYAAALRRQRIKRMEKAETEVKARAMTIYRHER
jgi:hypothetical protein